MTTSSDTRKSGSTANQNWLLIAALTTVALWQLPFGNFILYPFTILATWFHEMGHGLAALALGGGFHKLLLLPDGAGVAEHSGVALGRIGRSLVASGGPMGPAVAGALLIAASRNVQTTRAALSALGLLLLASAVIWVRTAFGFVMAVALGLAVLALVARGSDRQRAFGLQFLGVQACVSCWRQLDYLFSRGGIIAGRVFHSDTAQMAENLWLPYWFWGAAMAAASAVMLVASVRYACQDMKVAEVK